MDTYEATKVVLSRIQSLDPENASRIMGYVLIQDQGEKEMIRLAFGPESLLVSVINQAKGCLGLSSNTSSAPSTPSSPSPFNAICNPNRPNSFPQSSPRIIIPENGFHMNPSSPSSPWSASPFSDHHYRSPRPPSSLSYAAVVNGTTSTSSASSSPSFPLVFYGSNSSESNEEHNGFQVKDQFPFLDEPSSLKNPDLIDPIVSPSGRSDSMVFPYRSSSGNWVDSANCGDNHHHLLHRRSCSVNDVFLGGGSDDGGAGFGWRPCMYFARGFCKNGTSCKFLHGGFTDSPDGSGAAIAGSPNKLDGFDELLRMKALQQQQQQQQRFAAASQLMAAGPHPFPYNKCMNFLNDNQRSTAASLMMGEEFQRLGWGRGERNEFAAMGFLGSANSSSRQIYLTFPADSTFREEDVSRYFSTFGPVQDVRIPYQQKRMFGFVTFVHPETVKLILAKGNPHFVCDSRVLVKPYKEKGKIPEKKHQHQHQQIERGDFPACLSPSGIEREPYELPFGARMFYNTPEMMLRRKMEEQQAEVQQNIEFQGRRLMNLQLMEKNHHHNYQFQPNLLSNVHHIPSPTQPHVRITQNMMLPSDFAGQELEGKESQDTIDSPTKETDQEIPHESIEAFNEENANYSGNGKNENANLDDSRLHESLEHILPDNLFASPTKSAADRHTAAFAETDDSPSVITSTSSSSSNNNPMLPAASPRNMASLKSCFFQMPRFSSGQEAIEM